MTKLTDGDIFWLLGLAGSTLGIILNSYLIASLASKWKRYPFACLFISTSVFDLIFSLVEITTQHQIAVKNGIMFVLPRGIEWLLADERFLIEIVFVLHCAVCMGIIFILPALYNYHYVFVRNGCQTPGKMILFKNLAITSTLAILVALSAALGIKESMERGREYYTKMFDDAWFQENAEYFLYRDPGTIGYFAGGLLVTSLSIALTSYYAFRARLINISDDFAHRRNEIPFTRTQFTRALILRTINTWLLALLPISLVTIAIIFRVDIEVLGDLVMSPWCFLPFANAATTLFVTRK